MNFTWTWTTERPRIVTGMTWRGPLRRNTTASNLISAMTIQHKRIRKIEDKDRYSKDRIKNLSSGNVNNEQEFAKKIDSLNIYKS